MLNFTDHPVIIAPSVEQTRDTGFINTCLTGDYNLRIMDPAAGMAIENKWICEAFFYITLRSAGLSNTGTQYNDVIMDAIASQITSLTIVYSTAFSGAAQRKHQSSASLAFVRGIHLWPVNSPYKWPVTRKCFHLMTSSWVQPISGGVHAILFLRSVQDISDINTDD